jgi:hypothetical protein
MAHIEAEQSEGVVLDLPTTYAQEEEFESMVDEAMEKSGAKMPQIGELITVAEAAESRSLRAEISTGKTEWATAEEDPNELDSMMSQLIASQDARMADSIAGKREGKGKEQVKPGPRKHVLVDSPSTDTKKVDDYQESFASQREAAEMREEIESLSLRMSNLERTLETVLKERQALPGHLSHIHEQMNQQFTLVMDKLNGALEQGVKLSSTEEAASLIASSSVEVDDQMRALRSFASAPPQQSSPITRATTSLTGKRRFKPLK